MAAHGHQVEILTQTRDRQLPGCEVSGGVTVRRFLARPPHRHLAVAPALLAHLLVQRTRYEIVHAHNYHALPALHAAICRPSVLVISPYYHGTGHAPFRRLLHLPYRLCGHYLFRQAAAVICLSDAEATLVHRHFGHSVPRTRVHVIPHGVEMAHIRAAVPFPTTAVILLSVGRLEHYKQTHRLIEIMTRLDTRFALHIVGDGPERARLEALSRRLGVVHRVSFHGRLDDQALARWFRTAAVYVNLSRHESFGIAVLEALSAGARVVASDIPAFREHVRRTGSLRMALVPVDASAHVVARTIDETARCARSPAPLPEAALPSWEAAVEQTMRIYQELT